MHHFPLRLTDEDAVKIRIVQRLLKTLRPASRFACSCSSCRTIEVHRMAGFFFDFFLRCGVYALSNHRSSVVIQEGARVALTGLFSHQRERERGRGLRLYRYPEGSRYAIRLNLILPRNHLRIRFIHSSSPIKTWSDGCAHRAIFHFRRLHTCGRASG